ncbi:hypothetical protein VTN49DRAFT_15 [Thermomyces lanuginosus]|uniref:uncharacterized protein n=1 Tax=Thermomyces lanuginosus TaxID=5541 RepID=UPI0037423D45
MGWAGTSRMRRFLSKTSQDRILTTYLYGKGKGIVAQSQLKTHKQARSSTRRWVENMGKNLVAVTEGENDLLAIDGLHAVQAQPLLQKVR